MTTIVFDANEKVIAFDSRMTRCGRICTDSGRKHIEREGVHFFFCGATADNEAVMEGYLSRVRLDQEDIGCACFAFDDGVLYSVHVDHCGQVKRSVLYFSDSIGSGEDFAIAALDFGKSAGDAVAYAATRDPNTGGPIHIFNLETCETKIYDRRK